MPDETPALQPASPVEDVPAQAEDVADDAAETKASLPIAETADAIIKAASENPDLAEDTLEIPEFGFSVRIRQLSAYDNAKVKGRVIVTSQEKPENAYGEAEVYQFMKGVIQPRFDEGQVRRLQAKSGPGFQRVIDALDELAGNDKEEMRRAADEFQDSGEPDQG